MRLACWGALLGSLVVLLMPSMALASTTIDIRGTYVGTSSANGSDYSIGSVIDSVNCATGAITGRGVNNGETYSNFTGAITGDLSSNTITTHEEYTGVNTGYKADGVGSVSLDSQGRMHWTGTFTDTNRHTGPFDSTRVSGPPNDGAGCDQTTTTTGTASTSSSSSSSTTTKPSATSVQCNYDSLMQLFSCTAQVADASGAQPPQTPTGTVAFALDPGADGSFPEGSTCTLKPSTFGPTAFCSVTYLPGQQGVPPGTQPRLSGTYSGDATFASSSGRPTNQYGVGPISYTDTTTTSSSTTSSSTTSSSTVATSTTTTTKPKPHCNASVHAARDFYAAMKPSTGRTLTAGGHPPRRARTLSRAQADRRAIALLGPSRAPLANGVELYGLARSLKAGSVITEARLGLARRLLPALRIREPGWLYWENLGPPQRYMHPSVVLVIAAKGGRVLARAKFATYPEVNGRPATFVSSRHPHVLYRRGPGRRHPIKLSGAELARLRAALAISRGHKVLAHTSDVSKSTLITAVDHQSNDVGDTFINEEAAITQVFASHGVSTRAIDPLTVQQRGPESALRQQVDAAAAAGQTTITIFLDGHGSSPGHANEGTVQYGNGVGTITASDLTTIAQAHPDVKFSFIIDSCYSGRFVDLLSVEPNVASITTSSGAEQPSSGPLAVQATPPAGEKYSEFTGPGLTGLKLYVTANDNPAALSPFTAGEVVALEKAFKGKGADPDVTSVLKEARTLEPTYDVAAEAGYTNPSPDPFGPGTTCGEPPGAPLPDDWVVAS